jgi:flagellar FliJ protein
VEELCDRVYDEVKRKIYLNVVKILLENQDKYYMKRGVDGEAERLTLRAAEAELELEKARALYIEASRDRKVLDKLREKRMLDYRKALGKEEIRTLDDISGGAPARKLLGG